MAEHKEDLVNINKTMEKIEEELKDKKLSKYNKQAEVIYIFYFSDRHDKDFIDKFVKYFKKDISNQELIEKVNSEFGVDIKSEEFSKIMTSIKEKRLILLTLPTSQLKTTLTLWSGVRMLKVMVGDMFGVHMVRCVLQATLMKWQRNIPVILRQADK